MSRILAIEPNHERGAMLERLLREHLDAAVVLATSTEAALAAMSEDPPDLVLTSSLLSPNEEQLLAAHLRSLPGLRHLPVLTIPPVVGPDEPSPAGVSGLLSRLLGRRPPPVGPAYDFAAVAARIRETIDESRQAIEEERSVRAPLLVDRPAPAAELSDEELRACCGLGARRKRARRWNGPELPWIGSVKLPTGLELRLLNISTTGVLVESGLRLTPGSRTAFQVAGSSRDLLISAKIVRSRVSTVDPLGVRYQSAAVFDQAFESLAPHEPAPEPAVDLSEHLADLVARVRVRASRGVNAADLRAEFEAGVHELVTAREIRMRAVPIVENDGRDSVYFTIPTRDGSPAILQVTFEPQYRPCQEEFAALRAAALAAADILECTEPAGPVSRIPA